MSLLRLITGSLSLSILATGSVKAQDSVTSAPVTSSPISTISTVVVATEPPTFTPDYPISLPTVLPTAVSTNGPSLMAPSVDNVTTTPATNETNACSELEAGDVVVTLMNSDNPDQLAFFALTTVSPEVDTIFVTDQAWNGTSFMGNEEGTMAFTVPETSIGVNGKIFKGIGVGSLFSYGFGEDDDKQWALVEENSVFNLNVGGDTVLVYCLNADGSPHFLSGFSYAPDGWLEPGLTAEEYGGIDSSLPDELSVNGSVAVPYFQNYMYAGESSSITTKEELVQAFGNPSNYEGQNEIPYLMPTVTSEAWSLSTKQLTLSTTIAALVLIV